jgi:hypothetical protein
LKKTLNALDIVSREGAGWSAPDRSAAGDIASQPHQRLVQAVADRDDVIERAALVPPVFMPGRLTKLVTLGREPTFEDVGPVSGDIVWIGRACDGDEILNEDEIADGGIAIVRRGECTFREKNFNADAAGADAVVIANNIEDDTPWGGVRIWDYSDEENPVLASIFDTVCSASPDPIPECDPRGTWSVHNVIVEKDKAYFSWYSDGVLVLDISDPYNPVEVARWHQAGPEWEESNGGIERVRIDPLTLEPRFKIIGSNRWSDQPGFAKVAARLYRLQLEELPAN